MAINKTQKGKNMSKPVPAPAKVAPKTAPPTPAPAAVAATNGEAKTEKPKRAKVRLVSKTIPGFWVRAFVDVIQKHGYPLDPNGNPLEVGTAARFGLSPEEHERRKADKEAEKAKFEAMSDEDKVAYAAKVREERAAKRLAKKAAERDKLIAQIKADMAAGKL